MNNVLELCIHDRVGCVMQCPGELEVYSNATRFANVIRILAVCCQLNAYSAKPAGYSYPVDVKVFVIQYFAYSAENGVIAPDVAVVLKI